MPSAQNEVKLNCLVLFPSPTICSFLFFSLPPDISRYRLGHERWRELYRTLSHPPLLGVKWVFPRIQDISCCSCPTDTLGAPGAIPYYSPRSQSSIVYNADIERDPYDAGPTRYHSGADAAGKCSLFGLSV